MGGTGTNTRKIVDIEVDDGSASRNVRSSAAKRQSIFNDEMSDFSELYSDTESDISDDSSNASGDNAAPDSPKSQRSNSLKLTVHKVSGGGDEQSPLPAVSSEPPASFPASDPAAVKPGNFPGLGWLENNDPTYNALKYFLTSSFPVENPLAGPSTPKKRVNIVDAILMLHDVLKQMFDAELGSIIDPSEAASPVAEISTSVSPSSPDQPLATPPP